MELKPRFECRFSGTTEEAICQLTEALSHPSATCKGGVREGFLQLSTQAERPHFWAPQLRARFVPMDDHTLVRGRFAPKPDTWTMFLAIYALVVFSTGVGTVFGLSQLSLGASAWALWSLPIGMVLVACVWLGARLGQELGAEDMKALGDFVRATLAGDPSA